MTLAEKILAAHCGKKKVRPGDLINVRVDLVLSNDITAPLAIKEFRRIGVKKVFDPKKVVMVPDHFVPNKDIPSAEQAKMMREFAAAMATGEMWMKVPPTIKFVYNGKLRKWISGKDLILYTIGDIGVDGALYRAMELTGEAIENMGMAGRLTMCNMAIEAGAKNGIKAPDKITEEYVKGRAKRPYKFYQSDKDARYVDGREYDCTKIEPVVACPHLPENSKFVRDLNHVTIDQVFIGSCTNGRIEDLREAASVIKGRKVAPYVRMIVIPATQEVYRQAQKEGLFDIFLDANASISTPTCGPCLGGHMGVLAKGERAVATSNRNFVGRMGHPESEVYLSNPAVAAASAGLRRGGGPAEQ